METKTFYVTLFRRFTKNRWVTSLNISEEMEPMPLDGTIAEFRVAAPTKAEVTALVMEWLLTSRPAHLPVNINAR